MSTNSTIRPARPADLEAIGRLGAMLVVEHHDFDPLRFIAPQPDTPRRYGEFLVSQIGASGKLVLVAEVDGAVAGYAYGGIEGNDFLALRGPAGLLYDLVVDPTRRRQGIGRQLLDAALAELGRLGAPRVLLFTAEKNRTAQAVFEQSGFRRTMIEMTRELPDSPALP